MCLKSEMHAGCGLSARAVRSMTRSLRRPSASLARGAPEPSKDFRCTSPDRACVMLPLVWKTTPQKLLLCGGGESNHEAEVLGFFLNAADFVLSIFFLVV